jgi:hypothetical protein
MIANRRGPSKKQGQHEDDFRKVAKRTRTPTAPQPEQKATTDPQEDSAHGRASRLEVGPVKSVYDAQKQSQPRSQPGTSIHRPCWMATLICAAVKPELIYFADAMSWNWA